MIILFHILLEIFKIICLWNCWLLKRENKKVTSELKYYSKMTAIYHSSIKIAYCGNRGGESGFHGQNEKI